MSDEQLSDIFKRDIPTPGDGDWSTDARRRAGRRRATIGGAAVLAAVALISPFALQMMNTGGDSAVPAPIGTEPLPPADRALACDGAAEAAVDELPEQAARLWLCDEPGDIGFSRTGPQEPLTQGVDEALAAFRDLPKADPNQACTMEYTLTYVVVAEAADGTMTPVRGELHGCRTVGNRSGGDGFLTTLGSLWQAQRDAEPAPQVTHSVDQICAPSGSIFPATVESATQAALCNPNDGTDTGSQGVALPAELLERVQGDIAGNAVDGTLGEWEPTARLVFSNPYGEAVTLTRFPSGSYALDGGKLWRPKGDLAAELDALVADLGRPATQPVVPERPVCTDARNAAAATPAVIGGDFTGVYLCIESKEGQPRVMGPGGGLYEPAFVARAVEAFNSLPVVDGECTVASDSGPEVYVVYSLTDGTSVAVRADGCPSTGAVQKDGDLIGPLVALIREQVGEQSAMYFGAQELCPRVGSLVPFSPESEAATQIVACLGPDGGLAVDLPQELVKAISGTIESSPQPDGWEAGEGTLTWVNKYGEPMTLVRGTDGTFGWEGPDGPRSWAPSADVQAQLDRIFGL